VLLRLVLREGTLAAALAAGSAALLASLYFTRVVHPNYLVLAAVLLPLAFLMGHRAAAEVAVAPLLLLGVAVEMVEGEVFRAAWAQALSPHPLTVDPFGLTISAAVAGIAVALLCDGLLGAPRWRRGAWLAAGATWAVVVPTVFVIWSGQRTGVARAQDEWLAHVVAPAPALEAWSPSFRRDPPGPLSAGLEAAPAGPRAPVRDPRPLTLAAAGLAAFFLARLAAPGARLLILAGAMLSPAMVLSVVFGSPQSFVLAGLAGGALLARARGWQALTGLLAGGLLAALAAAAVAGGPRWSAIGPGLGLSNIFLYWGAEASAAAIVLTFAAIGLVGAAVLAGGMRAPGFAAAAAAWLVGSWFLPSASPHAIAAPLALIVLAAVTTDEREPAEDARS
jgi:hypothetical protein